MYENKAITSISASKNRTLETQILFSSAPREATEELAVY